MSAKSAVAAAIAVLERSKHQQATEPKAGTAAAGTKVVERARLDPPQQNTLHTASSAAASWEREKRVGEAILADVEVDVLSAKRRRLVQLSRDVLEVRCPGFCSLTPMTEDECLREAGHALATISEDVLDAMQTLRAAKAGCPSE